jgi:histidinol-phosphatase (PHP family)
MGLTGDGHVHSEWSWDVGLGNPHSNSVGRMESMCRRAVQIGLPALAFTEHLDVTSWPIEPDDLPERMRPLISEDRVLTPPLLDAEGYLDSVDRCRHTFPELRILTGVEHGQPHLDEARARQVIDLDALDRVNGSLHTIPITDEPGSVRSEPYTLYRLWPADKVLRENLAEVPRMLAGSSVFTVFCHIEYAVRYWPKEQEGPFNPKRFEDEFRQAMRAIAGSGRALELNIGGPIRPWIPQWWAEEGGRAITFGSDAHATDWLAGNFYEAMAMADHFGFRPGRQPEDFWTRRPAMTPTPAGHTRPRAVIGPAS